MAEYGTFTMQDAGETPTGYGTFKMSGAPVLSPDRFTMYDPPPGDESDNPVPYEKKDRTRELPKPGPKERELYSTKRIRARVRQIYYKDP